jgi:uncharacterized lipoprotein YddW (UPF0748 family)
MKQDFLKWMRWCAPLGLALFGLLLLVAGLGRHSVAGQPLSPAPQDAQVKPSLAQQQVLWAALGLNDAWYVAHGYTTTPPPPAASPILPPGLQRSHKTFPLASSAVTGTPHLVVDPRSVILYASAEGPRLVSATVSISNHGGGTLRWVAQLVPGGLLTPTLVPTSGLQGDVLTLMVDSAHYQGGSAGLIHTRRITVSALPGETRDSPQVLTATLYTFAHSTYLPQVIKQVPPSELEVRAIWVTRYDWTSAYAPEGPADIDAIVDNVAAAGFNTIFFQVRAHGDAYYTPGLEPWSARLNDDGVLGQDPGWDPLARTIDQAHARGLQVHAYVNVYPAWRGITPPTEHTTPEQVYWTWSRIHPEDVWRQWHQADGPMQLGSGYLWASPGVDSVRDHVVAMVRDIVGRYEVDGVHLDLVRYAGRPYSYDPFSNAGAGDVETEERARWQRDRVTDLVGRVYAVVGEVRPQARLSAAVWFCYSGDGCGYGLSSGYADYYQDSLGWLSEGVIDAIAPMLYQWSGFDDLEIWRDVMQQFQDANAGRHVYPGISGDFDDFAEIAARIQAARDAGAAGHVIFSYSSINARGYWDDLAGGPYMRPATPPPLSWR